MTGCLLLNLPGAGFGCHPLQESSSVGAVHGASDGQEELTIHQSQEKKPFLLAVSWQGTLLRKLNITPEGRVKMFTGF